MNPATRAQPLPAYLQISELLLRQVSSGHWQMGERLPTEAALAETLKVAVGTLRKALAILEERGVLERVQGSGTYVKKASHSASIYEFFRLESPVGWVLPSARILEVKLLKSPPEVPKLGVQGNSHAWRVRRLRMLGEKLAALEEIWFDARHCAALQPTDLGDAMYYFYQTRFGIWITRAEDRVSTAAVPNWAVKEFGVSIGKTCAYVERQSWTANNQIEEFSRTWFDPAICYYKSKLS